MLSHLSIQLLLYGVNTNFATLIISLPLLRAYFRSFMGRNQFKKVRSRPLKKSEAEEVRQGKGVPFRRALHTFGTPCTLRCTPFSIEVCRRFFLFSLVYEPFLMLSRRPARTTERTNRHNLPSPCRIPSVRPPASDCRPQGGHPCIERTRDAQGRSNIPSDRFRGVLRHEKSPRGTRVPQRA